MKDASTNESRVLANASNSELYPHIQEPRCPTQETPEGTVYRNISWIGPQQMATWRVTGYVADSEDEDQEIDFSFGHHDASQHSQRGENHDDDRTALNGTSALSDNGGLLENFQAQIKATSASSPNTVIDTAHEKHAHADTQHLHKNLVSNSRSDHDLGAEDSTEAATVNPLCAVQSPDTIAQRLEVSVSHGQSITGNVLSYPSNLPATYLDDIDSPLSTPPDSPTPMPVHVLSPTEDIPASPILTSTIHAANRSFRPRKAIQINPYLLDYAKHQKEWGERGLKPVHIPRMSSPERRTHGEESQEFASRDDSQASENIAQESMDLDEVSQIHDLASFDPTDEDLPDLNVLLHEHASRSSRRLKQKTGLRKSNEGTSKQRDVFDLPSENETSHQGGKTAKQLRLSKQNSFPSPPRSTSSPLADHSLSSISEVRVSLKPLTPMASAGFRTRRRRIIEDDSQSQTEVEKAFVIVSSSEGDSGGSETEVEPEEVRIMQRRLRGVLPASVMTIQKAQQEMIKKRREAAKAAAKAALGPGVAERKLNKTAGRVSLEKPTSSNWYEDLVSENEDSERDQSGVAFTRNEDNNEIDTSVDSDIYLHEDPEAMEIMDDDGIDPMLPARPRTKRIRAKMQTNLQSINVPGLQQRKRRHREYRAGSISRPRKRSKQPSSGNVIHVYDAPALSPGTTIRPSWLRVAARQAKRTKAPGTAASKKFFQLDSPEETAAVLNGVNQRKRDMTRKRIKAAREAPRHDTPRQTDRHVLNLPKTPCGSTGTPQAHQIPLMQSPEMDEIATEPHSERTTTLTKYDDNALLRLTRLRSLLPLKNRAGQGRFVHKPSKPRVAQVEEVLQSYTGLSHHTLRRSPAMGRQPQRSVDWSIHPVSASKGKTEPERMEQSLPGPALPDESAKGSRPRKKQTPVYRPILHQTLLVPLAQDTARLRALVGQTDTNVRMVLEREFVTHQAEWFQGRKDGIICANEATQRHFRVFLEVLGSYLSAILEASNEVKDMRELRSFIYRLVPNRGSIGAQGQVGDKTMDVLEFDIFVAKNVFDLHVCLMNLAPAYAPLPRVLETKVNFVDAHNEICLTALSAWQAICDHHHTQHLIADGLSNWLYLILTQLISRWKSAEGDARAEAERSAWRVEEHIIRKVIEHNRAQASDLIIAALNCLVRGIEYATGAEEAASLLNLIRYTEFTAAFVKLTNINNEVCRTMLRVVSSYTKQWLPQSPPNISPLLSCLRQAITAFTSYESAPSSELRLSMIQTFFSTAQVAVSHRQKSWDDFFVPTSSFSLDMFVSNKYQDTSKALFYHFLLENDHNAYLIDFRGVILNQWLRVLLQSRNDDSSALLTYSIFTQEKDSLAIPSLAASFHPPGSTLAASAIRNILPEIRYAATMHVIAHLSGQENSAEAEWLPGGLDESDAVRLLKTIFTTMKETWMSLSENPEEQDAYTVLVHAALEQYEIHSRSDFKIEPWFSNSAMFPQRRKHSLAQLFTKRVLSDIEFIRSATDVMQQEIAHARRFDRMHNLEEELKELLLPTAIDTFNVSQSLTQILSRHVLFIRDVLPLFIRSTSPTHNDTSSMLLNVLIHITSNIECYITSRNGITTNDFTEALIATVAAVSEQLPVFNADDRAKVYTLALLTFELSVAAGDALSDSFMDNIGRICDLAMQDESREGLALMAGIIGKM